MKDYDKLYSIVDDIESGVISMEDAKLLIKNDVELSELVIQYSKEKRETSRYPSRREFKKRFNK